MEWIAEYADACDKYQEKVDQEVWRFAKTPEEYQHWPKFHLAYFPYIGRTLSNRNIWEVQFYPCYKKTTCDEGPYTIGVTSFKGENLQPDH